ncbi:MAG: SURF1 family protein [Pseudomonadota bacterium]
MSANRPIRRWLVLLVAAAATLILLSLSYWQYSKIGPGDSKIAAVQSMMAAPPAPLPLSNIAWADWAYRPVTALGVYAPEYARHVYRAGPKGGSGYHLLVPLLREGALALWVDLGWFPDSQKRRYETPSLPQGPVTVSATVIPRQRDAKLIDPAKPDPAANRYYRIQPEILAEGTGLVFIQTHYLLAKPALKGLVQTDVPIKLEHNHRSYAFQWLAMAAALMVITAAFLRRR